MSIAKMLLYILLFTSVLLTMGCGGVVAVCGVIALNASPPRATADHMAQPPQNSQTFAATLVVSNVPGCPAVTGTRAKTIWSASDPSVRLSTSESGQLNATCTTALPNPVTLTARQAGGEMLTAKATLVCQ